jgi:hypothetical protein
MSTSIPDVSYTSIFLSQLEPIYILEKTIGRISTENGETRTHLGKLQGSLIHNSKYLMSLLFTYSDERITFSPFSVGTSDNFQNLDFYNGGTN